MKNKIVAVPPKPLSTAEKLTKLKEKLYILKYSVLTVESKEGVELAEITGTLIKAKYPKISEHIGTKLLLKLDEIINLSDSIQFDIAKYFAMQTSDAPSQNIAENGLSSNEDKPLTSSSQDLMTLGNKLKDSIVNISALGAHVILGCKELEGVIETLKSGGRVDQQTKNELQSDLELLSKISREAQTIVDIFVQLIIVYNKPL